MQSINHFIQMISSSLLMLLKLSIYLVLQLACHSKKEIIEYVDEVDEVVKKIGSCNTVINSKGYLKAFNTDWIGVKIFTIETLPSEIVIAGNGGFSNAAQYAFQQMKISYKIVKRDNWYELDNTSNLIFNATPAQNFKPKTLLMQDH